MSTENPFARSFKPFQPLDERPNSQAETAPWPLPGVLPRGLTLMTGDPYCGKTSLAYQFALRAGCGQSAFNGVDKSRGAQRHVLFLGLDSSSDQLDQLAERYLKAHPESTLPHHVSVTNTWKDLTPAEGLAELETALDSYPDLCLFVIDNLEALRTLFRGNDRKLFALLRSIAEQRGISVLLLHTAKASTSLTTHVDHHLHLKRLAVSSYYHLDVRGRPITPTSYQLYCRLDGIDFHRISRYEEFALATHGAQRAITPERVALLSVFALSDEEVLTPSQLAAVLGIDEYSVKHVLGKMLRAHLLTSPRRLRYTLSASIKPLLEALFAQYSLLTDFALEELPPPSEAEMAALKEKASKTARRDETLPESGESTETTAAQRLPQKQQSAHVLQPNRAQRRLAGRRKSKGRDV